MLGLGGRPTASFMIGMEEVLVARRRPGGTIAPSTWKTSVFSCSFSTTASITRSRSANSPRSVVKRQPRQASSRSSSVNLPRAHRPAEGLAQPGAPRLRGRVVHLADQHVVAGPRGHLGDARPHDAAADDTDLPAHGPPRAPPPGGVLRRPSVRGPAGAWCPAGGGLPPGFPLDRKPATPPPAQDHDAAGRRGGPVAPCGRRAGGARVISGKTTLIAHLGYPTFAFKSPMIYNPWFEKNDIDAVVVPMGVKAEDYPEFFRIAVQADQHPRRAGHHAAQGDHDRPGRRADADRRRGRRGQRRALREDGTLLGDQFDGEGFARGVLRKGFDLTGKRALVVGNGGVGSPIAASLAAAGVAAMGLFDPNAAASEALASALRRPIPSSRSRPAPRTRTATTSSSTRPRWA